MPPPPEEGAIPDWHLATGVKPLRPLPQDLTDTMRLRLSGNSAETESAPGRAGPRVKRMRTKTRPSRISGRHLKRPRRWGAQAAVMLLTAVIVGTVVGALVEQLTRMFRGG